ncbi:FRG domain protein [Rhizobium leguminosarum bv. trifolii WSM2012]|nr:FRG domain protein [Rhizobium leguminosarum bv. trifolii WSM2012]
MAKLPPALVEHIRKSNIHNRTYVTSVEDFIKQMMSVEIDGQLPMAFRGQRSDKWRTAAPILRKGSRLLNYEKEMVRDLISIHPQEFQNDMTMFDRLVRMQHFGLPTRLLDVSTNPLVALYFAAEDGDRDEPTDGKVFAYYVPNYRRRYFDSDVVSCMANLSNLSKSQKEELERSALLPRDEFNEQDVVARLANFIRLEKPSFLTNIDPNDLYRPVYVLPKMSNRRIIAQSGAFIIYGLESKSGTRYDTDIKAKAFFIRAADKQVVRNQLERLGIHPSSLFPEIDKAAGLIVSRYLRE